MCNQWTWISLPLWFYDVLHMYIDETRINQSPNAYLLLFSDSNIIYVSNSLKMIKVIKKPSNYGGDGLKPP